MKIEEKFGLKAGLVEGHDGIYEIMVNDEVIFTNRGKCGQFPMDGEILGAVSRFTELLPGKKLDMTEILPMFGTRD